MQKCMYNQVPSYLCEMFTKRNQIHDRETRNQNELDIPKYRTATGYRTFKYRGTKIWDVLDEQLKLTANLKHFKSKLKARLLRGMFAAHDVLLSDKGPLFNSIDYKRYSETHGTAPKLSTPLWPHDNGQAQRFMKCSRKALQTANIQN